MRCIKYLSQLDHQARKDFGFVDAFLPETQEMTKKEFFTRGALFLRSNPSPGSGTPDDAAAHVIINYFMAPERKRRVLEHSLLLRGRIRWSILYIEHLLARYLAKWPELEDSQGTGQTPENSDERDSLKWIGEQCSRCQDIIKSSLHKRLRMLAADSEGKYHYMLDDLFCTAVRAELMHKPCILQDNETGQLITQGFAILSGKDGNTVWQRLAEPLAVTAVTEYFRNCGNKHSDVLKRMLFSSQQDPSAFGTAAEYYLAWVSLCSLLLGLRLIVLPVLKNFSSRSPAY
jgi:hypothetical protein